MTIFSGYGKSCDRLLQTLQGLQKLQGLEKVSNSPFQQNIVFSPLPSLLSAAELSQILQDVVFAPSAELGLWDVVGLWPLSSLAGLPVPAGTANWVAWPVPARTANWVFHVRSTTNWALGVAIRRLEAPNLALKCGV